jgi:NADP-dependent 3-hydroxy acid dehydrogenase YdfG
MKYIIPTMKKNNSGTIINIASRAGRRAVPKLSAYTAAKFAVRGLTESVAKEVQDTNIKCISISPAGVNTRMRAMVFGDEDSNNQQTTDRISKIISDILLGKLQVTNGSDVVIKKDQEPIIREPEEI